MHDSFASMYIHNMHTLYECFTCVYVCVYAPLYMPDAHRGQKEVSGPLPDQFTGSCEVTGSCEPPNKQVPGTEPVSYL